MNECIYLDHNANYPVHAKTIRHVCDLMQSPQNGSSINFIGQQSKKILEKSREKIKNILNAQNYNVIFTSSGTESNNLVVKSFANAVQIISAIEHKSVIEPATNPIFITVNKQGVIPLDSLCTYASQSISQNKKIFVSVMAANNETGVIQPIKEIGKICKEKQCVFHSDMSQYCGKLPINLEELDIDIITISSHKFGGPLGSSAILFKKNITLIPQIVGGGQENGIRSSTENVYAISGMAYALEYMIENQHKMKDIERMRDKMEDELKSFIPNIKIFSEGAKRLPNTSCICIPDLQSALQIMKCDQINIAVSNGSACASGTSNISHVLKAMCATNEEALCTIRVSLGLENKKSDIDKFVKIIVDLHEASSNI